MAETEEDLAWALPYVEQARHSVAAGEFITGEDFAQELDLKIADLRATLAASIAEGGRHSPEDALAFLAERRAARRQE